MRTAQVAIVGAGPAGIAAALASAGSGAAVLLIDEQQRPGGRMRWTLSAQDLRSEGLVGMRGFEFAEWADGQLAREGVAIAAGAVAWGLFEDRLLTVSEGERSYQLRCESIVIASGATDLTIPFSGWELPGVMTATAFLKAVNLYRVLPGRSIMLIGAGSDADEVATSATMAGGTIVARTATTEAIAAHGAERVASVTIGGEVVGADIVVIALGRQPDPELAFQALCEIGYSRLNGCHVPLRDATLETSLSSVYAAGDAAGLCSTAEAWAEGRVAGLAAARSDELDNALAELAALRSAERRDELQRLMVAVRTG